MRRTVSVFVCVLVTSLYAGLNAQIPERVEFYPGSYGFHQRPATVNTVPVATDAAEAEADESWTEWERKFSPQTIEPATISQPVPQPYEVPHLTFVYNHWTGRFHIVPYEPGYAANPAAFPKQTSPLHIWVSARPAASQPSPQVQYMSYYDPDPVILPAEIQLRGSRFAVPLTELQPMPMPVPRPATATPITPPARTRIGEQIRQNFSPFSIR